MTAFNSHCLQSSIFLCITETVWATSLISDFAYCDWRYRSVVCLSLCLLRSCIVLKRLKILTRFLLRTTVPCLSHTVQKFGLCRITVSSQNCDPPPVNLSAGDIRSQFAAEWLEIAQWSQWTAYKKPLSFFRMVPLLTPYDISFPKMESQTRQRGRFSPNYVGLCEH